ncbi:hypothetical protein BJ165DRAFT_1535026 [Panaeolus papilionaceus]|nr:hypothetical protein BJ165DRAFT_1535026 [Panaeolus papilionaceus]
MGHKRKAHSIQHPSAYHPDHDSFEDHFKAVKKALRLKQKTSITDLANEPLRAYAKAAKALTFKVDLFLDMDALLTTNFGYLYNSTDDEYPPEYSEEYWEVVRNMPGQNNRFHDLLLRIIQWHVKGSTAAEGFLTLLKDHSNSGRSDVVGSVKRYVVRYLPKKRGQAIVPDLVSDTDKALRGFSHVVFGEMIVGIRDRKAYRKDPRKYCQAVKNGEIQHVPQSLPSFLFHEDIAYDARTPEKGLGEGYLFVRVLRAILTTPSSAYGDKSEGRKVSRAYDWGLKTIPAKVASAIATIAYIGLSDMSEFGVTHGDYSVAVLYRALCKLFNNPSSKSKTLLENVTRSVPHLTKGPKAKEKQAADEQMHAFNPLEDIIRARKAEKAANKHAVTQRAPEHEPEEAANENHRDDNQDDEANAEHDNDAQDRCSHEYDDDDEANDDDFQRPQDGRCRTQRHDEDDDYEYEDEPNYKRRSPLRTSSWSKSKRSPQASETNDDEPAVTKESSQRLNKKNRFGSLIPLSPIHDRAAITDTEPDDPPPKQKRLTKQYPTRVLPPRSGTGRTSVAPGINT